MTPAALPWLIAIALNAVLLAIAWFLPKKLLTPAGYLHACVLGVLVWGCLGWRGYTVVMVYFLVGTAVTRIGMAEKEVAGIAEKRSGVRGPENVWGSALTATLCAIGSIEPKPNHGGPQPTLQLVEADNDATLVQLAARLGNGSGCAMLRASGPAMMMATAFGKSIPTPLKDYGRACGIFYVPFEECISAVSLGT